MSEKFDVKLDNKNYYPDPSVKENSWMQDYEKVYSESLKDPEKHWENVAEELEWFETSPTTALTAMSSTGEGTRSQ